MLVFYYTGFLNVDDRTSLDNFYADRSEYIVNKLKETEWGKTSRGKKILRSFDRTELRFITPQKMVTNNGIIYYSYENSVLNGPAEGMMAIEQGVFRIYISLYNINDKSLRKDVKTFDYLEFSIPEDELVHILVDELLSRYHAGNFFVDGEASVQEEQDAWRASEEALQAYYDDPEYKIGFSFSEPKYGASNIFYRKVE